MNINYHYFAVKTLGLLAGLKEEVAQKIAYCSQMVDDFSCKRPIIFLREKPDDFFVENGIASKWGDYYYFSPIRTAISFIRCLEPIHCKKTVVPFHFMPENKIENVENVLKEYNGSYICKLAKGETFLIWDEVNKTVNRIKIAERIENADLDSNANCNYEIINLGMLFHVFADTFAHYGFSGVHGKENWAEIEEVCLNGKKAGPVNSDSNFIPKVGHACLLHLPDAAGYTVQAMRWSNEDNTLKITDFRDNRTTFGKCSEQIYLWLLDLRDKFSDGTEPKSWEEVKDLFLDTLCKASDNYTETVDVAALTAIWKKAYSDYNYSYEKNIYNLSSSMEQIPDPYDKLTEEELEILETGSFEDIEALGLLDKLVITPSDDFFYYNKAAYEHRNKVIGHYKI